MQCGEKSLFQTSALGGTKIVIPLPRLNTGGAKDAPPKALFESFFCLLRLKKMPL